MGDNYREQAFGIPGPWPGDKLFKDNGAERYVIGSITFSVLFYRYPGLPR